MLRCAAATVGRGGVSALNRLRACGGLISTGVVTPRATLAAAALASIATAASLEHYSECSADDEDPMVFSSKGDPYKGVSVSAKVVGECLSAAYFGEKLRSSLAAWRESGRKGVWLEIPAASPEFIAVAQSQGFSFHHAEPGHLMMCAWLGDGESMLPANASHSVGVGIVCINERDEIVMVQEATGPAANRKGGFWKVPTGLGTALRAADPLRPIRLHPVPTQPCGGAHVALRAFLPPNLLPCVRSQRGRGALRRLRARDEGGDGHRRAVRGDGRIP
jgi:hypothetical protein